MWWEESTRRRRKSIRRKNFLIRITEKCSNFTNSSHLLQVQCFQSEVTPVTILIVRQHKTIANVKSLRSNSAASVFIAHTSAWTNVLLPPLRSHSSISPLYPASHSFPHSSAHANSAHRLCASPRFIPSTPCIFKPPPTLFLTFHIMSLFPHQLFKLLSVQQTTVHSFESLITNPLTSKTPVPAYVCPPLMTNIWHQDLIRTSLHKHGDLAASGTFAQQVHHLIVAHILDISLVDFHQNIPLL